MDSIKIINYLDGKDNIVSLNSQLLTGFFVMANDYIINGLYRSNLDNIIVSTIGLIDSTYLVYVTADQPYARYYYELVNATSGVPTSINNKFIGMVAILNGAIISVTSMDKIQTMIQATMSIDQSVNGFTTSLVKFDVANIDLKNELEITSTGMVDVSKFKCTQAGLYSVNGYILWDADGSGGNSRSLYIYKNGVEYSKNTVACNTDETVGISINQNIYLQNGDYIQIYGRQTTGSPLNILSSESILNINQLI